MFSRFFAASVTCSKKTCTCNVIQCALLVVQRRFVTYVWLLLGYPPLVVVHSLACFISWILVFTIPVFKMNARTLGVILLLPPEDVSISAGSQRKVQVTRSVYWSLHSPGEFLMHHFLWFSSLLASRLWDQSATVLLPRCQLVLLQVHDWWD